MTFKVKSPDGQRTLTFEGNLTGDQIVFHREVEEHGAPTRTPGFFGATGPRTFTAKRTSKRPDEK